MATEHIRKCVGLVGARIHELDLGRDEMREGIAAALELIDQPWDFSGDKMILVWREGYEQCMQDIVDAMADEWGVALPPDPLRVKEKNDGGSGQ